MSTFGITAASSQNDLVGAVNYALNNIGQGLSVNRETGQILIPNNQVPFAYAYQYMYVAFADSADGALNFSQDASLGYTYYGLWNTPTITPGGSTNPAQYIWYKVDPALLPATNFWYSVTTPFQLAYIGPANGIPDQAYELISPAVGFDLSVLTIQGLPTGGVQGDIPYITSPGVYGFISPGAADTVLTSDGSTATYLSLGQLTATGGVNAENIFVNSSTPDVYYYPAMVESFGTYTAIVGDLDLAFFNTSTGNILYTPNIETTGTITLSPLSAAPATFTVGTIAMANATSWDPATYSTTTPYLAVYNGTTWVALG